MKTKIACLLAATLAIGAGAAWQAQAASYATFFARIAVGGSVTKSLGVQEAARTAVGTYDVTFNRAVNTCGSVATVTDATPGYTTVDIKTASVLTVRTFGSNGAKVNRPFNIMVMCGAP
jgi:hypothetical protein